MDLVTDTERWYAVDDGRALTTWVADRADAVGRHLPPVLAVGRTGDGRLAADVLRPVGLPLAAALDVLGVPTTGVAVTLTLPLLELARAGVAGALVLGDARVDDVLVDDAGAVVLCDRPPGAALLVPAPTAVPDGPPMPQDATVPRRTADLRPAATTLLLAARLVWDRVDPRDPARPAVDQALASALGNATVDAVGDALDAVRAAAAPRPVRWDPPPADALAFVPPPEPESPTGPAAVLRDLVEHGLPLGSARRLPIRQALVGAVVAVGVVTTTLLTLHS